MTDREKWKRKVDALIRLAEDQAGKPEGELARSKLAEILEKHPEARTYEPLVGLARRMTTKDVADMLRRNISIEGSWTGSSLAEALARMEADFQGRILTGFLFGRPVYTAGADCGRREWRDNLAGAFRVPKEFFGEEGDTEDEDRGQGDSRSSIPEGEVPGDDNFDL